MISRDTGLTISPATSPRKTRAALFLTTAIAAAIPVAGQAATTTVVAAPLTTITVDAAGDILGNVNTATGTITTTNETVIVNGAVTQVGGGTLNAGFVAVGKGDGAIIFNNTSTIGTAVDVINVNTLPENP